MRADVTVRAARPGDAEALAAFNQAMAAETEGRGLDRDMLAAGVSAIFEHPDRGFYLVAERGGRPVGGLMVTTEWSDWRNGFFWWIQSVYVVPEARRTGVYRALHEAVRARAAARRGVCGIRLYVEGGNEGARRVYERLGMEATSYRLYEETFPAAGEADGTKAPPPG